MGLSREHMGVKLTMSVKRRLTEGNSWEGRGRGRGGEGRGGEGRGGEGRGGEGRGGGGEGVSASLVRTNYGTLPGTC